ncbi:hypothetical protein [Shigella phage ESh19]|nr:hypothetical protein [Shigella phage ESh19]
MTPTRCFVSAVYANTRRGNLKHLPEQRVPALNLIRR